MLHVTHVNTIGQSSFCLVMCDSCIFEFSSQGDKFGKLIAIITADGTLSIGSNLPVPLQPSLEKIIHCLSHTSLTPTSALAGL